MEQTNYPQNDLLNDLAINLERASTGKRFVNYLLDIIVYYAVVVFIFIAVAPLREAAAQGRNMAQQYLIFYILLFLLYFIQEGFMNGKTIGKFATSTRAVNEDGTPISARTAAIRSLCRLVPFEPFSAFGTPWHDKWTRTIVIDERKSQLPQ